MSVKQLRAFLAVAHTLNFAHASERLNISQPALSLTIKGLEEGSAAHCCNAAPPGDADSGGGIFLPMARQLLADWDNVEEAMRQSFTLQRGKISVAAMPSFAANVLPEVLKAFRDRYAGINVTVHDVINEQVIEMVREGRVEMGIAFEPAPTNNLLFTPLGVDRFIAIVPKSSPWPVKSVSLARAVDAGFYYAAAALGGPPDAGRGAGAQRSSAGCGAGESPAGDGGQNGGQRPGGSAVPALCQSQMQALGAVCCRWITRRLRSVSGRSMPDICSCRRRRRRCWIR
jgi:LysR family carnitine catabolism transcriptional activator